MAGGQNSSNRQPFCLHDWTVDPRNGEIRHQDRVTRLEPKAMDVLVYLADRPGDVVTRAELEETVWADVVVSYETLTSAIQRLRKAFDDDAHSPRFIETLPKRGYRLVAPVSLPSDATPSSLPHHPGPGAPKRLLLGMAALAIAVLGLGAYWFMGASSPSGNHAGANLPPLSRSDKPVIAVLPFTNMSEDKDQEYFSDGLTEDLITDLSKVSGLYVISRSATVEFKKQSQKAREIAEELGASHVIKGSVRKSKNTVRITVQLIDASSDYHLWGDRYDRELKDIFAIQDEVAGKIIAALSVKLTPEEKSRLAQKGTKNLIAHDLYLRARERESFFTESAYGEAVNLYQEAIRLDPHYADAYARLSLVYSVNAQFGWAEDSTETYKDSRKMAEKAVELNPSLPLAHYALGWILSRPIFAEHDNAIAEFKKVISLDPSHADSYSNLGFISNYTGKAAQAIDYFNAAMRINPVGSFLYYYGRGMGLYLQGDYAAALKDLKIAIERNQTVIVVHYWLAATMAQAGRIEAAEWQVEELRGMEHDMTMDEILQQNPIAFAPYREKFIEGMRKAGFK